MGDRARIPVQVRALRADEHPEAVALLARGMRDNPLHVAAFGPDPVVRVRRLGRLFRALLRVAADQRPLGAFDDGELLAVAGSAPPGTCRPGVGQRLRLAPAVAALGPRAAGRLLRWQSAWATHDPDRPHAHLGPVAVEPDRQGRGVGGQLLAAYVRRLDEAAQLGYLETDKPQNVRFYARYGFTVTDEAPVLGVPNWFMRRAPRPRGG